MPIIAATPARAMLDPSSEIGETFPGDGGLAGYAIRRLAEGGKTSLRWDLPSPTASTDLFDGSIILCGI
jgi:hypothetical protein